MIVVERLMGFKGVSQGIYTARDMSASTSGTLLSILGVQRTLCIATSGTHLGFLT